MDTQPEVVRLRVSPTGEEAREASAWRVGPGLYLTAASHLLGPRHREVQRVVVRAPGQEEQVLVVESDDESNLALLAPEVEGVAPSAVAGSEPLVVEVLGGSVEVREEWFLLEDAPTEVSNCLVLLSSAQGGQRLPGRLASQGDVLEVTMSPEADVEARALPGCPVMQGGKVVGLVTQRTRKEGRVLATSASAMLSLWRRRASAGPQGWRQRSFTYGTIQLFLAAIADSEGWKRELSSVDPRLAPGFGAYQLSVAQAQQAPVLFFLLRCLLGPLVTVLLFDLSLAGSLQRNPGLFLPGVLESVSQHLMMSYCLAMVGALGLSVLTGVGAAVGAATLGGLAGGVAALVTIPMQEGGWIVGGVTAGTLCGTACGVLWMQRVHERRSPTRGQLLAVMWGLLEGLVLVVSVGLIGLQFAYADLSWGMERERALGAVLGLLLVFPGLLAFFLRRRETPGTWFGTVLLGMVAVFASLGAFLQPILQNHQSSSLAFGASMGVLAGVGLCGVFSMMHALAENFGAGAWSDAAPMLGTCLLVPLGLLAFAGAEGRHLALLAENLLSAGLLSFGLVIARKWVRIRARYVGAGQHGSGAGVSPGV
jgi:hypothetical protein